MEIDMEYQSAEACSRNYRCHSFIVGAVGMREGTHVWRRLVLGFHFLPMLVIYFHQALLSLSVKLRKLNYDLNNPFLIQFAVRRKLLSCCCLERTKILYIN